MLVMAQEFNPSKSELKQLLRTLNRGWKALKAEDLTPGTPCPDSWTLASYVTGELDDKEAQKTINSHLAFCDSCFKDYAALVGPEKIGEMFSEVETKSNVRDATSKNISVDELNARWQRIRDEKMGCIIDLGRTYGANTHMGPVRIAAEKPAFIAEQWKSALNGMLARDLHSEWCDGELFKEVEVPVGENAYRVRVSATSKGKILCDISGLHTPVQTPLGVVLWETKDETDLSAVTWWRTDKFGNAHMKATGHLGIILVLTLVITDNERSVGFRIGEDVFKLSKKNLYPKIKSVASQEKIVEHLERMKESVDSLLGLMVGLPPSTAEALLTGLAKKKHE
jgi:hypothetical protein